MPGQPFDCAYSWKVEGNLGRLRYGLQFEYVRLTAFQELSGPITATRTPNQGLTPKNNIVFFSFRYYPFN